MWQSAAPFPAELVEKEGNLKRGLPQAFAAQMEPPVKRQAQQPPSFAVPPQMQSNLAAQAQQQQLLQQQAALQQAIARGQVPANFSIPVTQVNGAPQLQLQTPQLLAHLEKLHKEQQQMQQQQLQQQQQQLQQQQLQQQQIHQQQQQQHIQQLIHQRAMQQNGMPGMPPQMQQVPPQLLQGQVVRAGPLDLRHAEHFAQFMKLNPQLTPQLLQAQQAQLLQAHSAPAGGPSQNMLVPQMPGRRQTIGPATLTPQMVGMIPRMHHPSPKLIPTSSPLPMHMLPSSSCATPAAKSPFAAPVLPVRPPTAPTLIPTAKLTPPAHPLSQNPRILPPGILKGPDEPDYIAFLSHCRVIEQQIHSMLGDGMVRLPTTTKEN